MHRNSLQTFIADVRSSWGPLSSELIADCRDHLRALLHAAPTEDWLAALLNGKPASRELYRDADHGFVLLAHTEEAGLYRRPHDHGRSWVLYGVQSGDIEMGSYGRITDPDEQVRLVKRDATVVRPGTAMTYLPGDIHDTHCRTGPALLFRFTERDLQVEDKQERRITRYADQDGVLRVARP
ncbi:hypothetical protein [Caulobacter sp. 1776]|uniref:hypothetical protein n=1 Tax=Caulobacter sp. 1776 TaxID=3156420 RepID=UPI003398D48B